MTGVRGCPATLHLAERLSRSARNVLVLDTLFLTMPISWRGTLAQYAGRLHRIHPAKREVIVYDCMDGEVPVLARMGLKRITGFKSLGYSVASYHRESRDRCE